VLDLDVNVHEKVIIMLEGVIEWYLNHIKVRNIRRPDGKLEVKVDPMQIFQIVKLSAGIVKMIHISLRYTTIIQNFRLKPYYMY
jgi:hypothetical protein